jgi:hypothetical protein
MRGSRGARSRRSWTVRREALTDRTRREGAGPWQHVPGSGVGALEAEAQVDLTSVAGAKGEGQGSGLRGLPGRARRRRAPDASWLRGCDSEDCVIGLCRAHHRAFDDGALDLLPFLSGGGFEAELAHMQGHYSDPLSVVHRLSGCRWAPERSAA